MSRAKNELARNVRRLLREFGEKLVLRVFTDGPYDVDTGTVTRVNTDHDVTCVIVQFNAEEIANDPTFVRDDRKAYILPVKGVVPKMGDTLIGVSDPVLIVAVRNVLLSETDSMVYVCQVRG